MKFSLLFRIIGEIKVYMRRRVLECMEKKKKFVAEKFFRLVFHSSHPPNHLTWRIRETPSYCFRINYTHVRVRETSTGDDDFVKYRFCFKKKKCLRIITNRHVPCLEIHALYKSAVANLSGLTDHESHNFNSRRPLVCILFKNIRTFVK